MKLTLKKISHDDYAVMSGNRCAGRIMLKPKAFGEAVWFWTITGPYVPQALQPSHGEADNLEDTKVAFKAKLTTIEALAEREDKAVVWIGNGAALVSSD